MEYVNLGRSGLKVSRLCLGTMNFGPYTTEADSFKIMNRALELGINFFDTANVYGGIENPSGLGDTEKIIGNWLTEDKSRRDKIVLATKVYGRMGTAPNQSKLSAYHIRKACEDSLKRMKTDHIDLYQMHNIDRETPWEEIFQAMEQLVREGKITYLGGRILCGVLEKSKEGRRTREPLQKSVEKLRPQLEAYEKLCKEINLAPADVALAWVLSNRVVTAPIIGPRTVEQLEQNVKSLDIKLDTETLKMLDEIWPGPGNQAPEAYAW